MVIFFIWLHGVQFFLGFYFCWFFLGFFVDHEWFTCLGASIFATFLRTCAKELHSLSIAQF